jgi:cytochrome b
MTSSAPPSKPARIRVWDLPTRIFHWTLVLCVTGALVTGTLGGGWMVWHGRLGLVIAGLLAFRLVWSVCGSTYARLDLRRLSPAAILDDIRGRWHGVGHSPLGSLSVVAMVSLLSVQVTTGLVSDDDIAFQGPWADAVSRSIAGAAVGWHHRLSDLVMVLVGLHVGAILWYQLWRKRDVLLPMLRGWASGNGEASARGGGLLPLMVAVILAALVVVVASGVLREAPPPPPPAESLPDW